MKISICLLSFFFILKGNAQSFELGKVTKSELEEKVHATDTSAAAAFIFKKAKTYFKYTQKNGFETITEYSVKLKIYKKEGFKWANFEIPYYVGYENLNDEMVSISKAFTYNLEKGKIVKEKVSSEGKFKEKMNEFWETKMITFPNVKEGSIIELKYELKTQNIYELPVFQFQYSVPVDYAQYQTEIPGFYLYKAIKNGYVDVTMNDVVENASQAFEDKYGKTSYLDYRQIKTIFEVMNVPGLIEENYVSNIDNYYGKIEHELQTIQYPNETPKQMATTWQDVAKSIYAEKEFGSELEKNAYYLNDLKRLTDKIDSKQERIKILFEYVKNKMSWNGKQGYYTKKGVEKAYNESTGNVAEINLILTSMLRMGGLNANPVLISTRDNGIALFPNRSKFNYVIASVEIDGVQYLLDATNKFATLKTLPLRDLNRVGRMITKDGNCTEVNLMPTYSSDDILNLVATIDNNGNLIGKVREQYSDFHAFKFRENYSGIAKESYLEKLEKKYSVIEINEYERSNTAVNDEPVVESYAIKYNNAVEIIGNKMFFSPLFNFAMTQNPFKQEDRQYPIDFSFPSKEKYLLNITIPDGFVVESMPKNGNFISDDKMIGFQYSLTSQEKQIQVSISLEIKNAFVPAENYATLKEFFRLVVDKENEKIVLKKI